jgi:pimeloyl-ACP methyl ester carboxylesterase
MSVWFASRSGSTLAGVVLGDGAAGVVLAHGPHGDVCEVLPYARVLVGLGYRVLAFDFNGFGESPPGPEFPRRQYLDRDVLAGAEKLGAMGVTKVVLVGSEFGGLGALIVAADARPPVAGVVDLSGPGQLAGMDGPAAAARLAVPVLFVVSAADPNVEDVRRMYAAAPASVRTLDVTPEDGQHALTMVDPTRDPHWQDVRGVVETFIRARTGQESGRARSLDRPGE